MIFLSPRKKGEGEDDGIRETGGGGGGGGGGTELEQPDGSQMKITLENNYTVSSRSSGCINQSMAESIGINLKHRKPTAIKIVLETSLDSTPGWKDNIICSAWLQHN